MKREGLPILTVLRFPAALSIVFFHYFLALKFPIANYVGLASGVSFFYVLSGFILYYNYEDLRDCGYFWIHRFARIWPVHVVTLGMAFLVLPFDHLLGHAHWPITLPVNLLLLHSWLPFHGSSLSYNGVSWSLSVEAFFYICFPWLLVAMKKYGPTPALVGSFVVGLLLVVLVNHLKPDEPGFGSYNPACRLFEFVLGMATCHLWFKTSPRAERGTRWSAYEAFATIFALGLIFSARPILVLMELSTPLGEWFGGAFTACSFALLIWVFAHQAGAISKALSMPFLVLLGEVSFAMYMCHQMLIRHLLLNHEDDTDFSRTWGIFATYMGLVFVVAFLLFYVVETPARKMIVRAYKKWRTGKDAPAEIHGPRV